MTDFAPFPMIRHISRPVTKVLSLLPLSANMVSTLSMAAGFLSAWAAMHGFWLWSGVFLVAAYVMDNCDGEIARLKNQSSEFGMFYDSFVDWAVHTAFFAALGIGVHRATGQVWWEWMGWIAAAGGTINYLLGLYMEKRERKAKGEDFDATGAEQAVNARRPEGFREWAVFAFRELSRADFCFIVLALGAFDVLWVLLPAGAIGAQVYWAAQFAKGASDYHV